MKVLLVNGSSKEYGCTYTALCEVQRALNEENIQTEIVFIGNTPMTDCIACGSCVKTGKCVFDDIVNQVAEKAKECDGFIFGSPVYSLLLWTAFSIQEGSTLSSSLQLPFQVQGVVAQPQPLM